LEVGTQRPFQDIEEEEKEEEQDQRQQRI